MDGATAPPLATGMLVLLCVQIVTYTNIYVVFRFTHIVVDHVTPISTALTPATPVIFVTSLEGHVFKYVQLTTDGSSDRSCLVEVLEFDCDGSGHSNPRALQIDSKQVRQSTVK